MIKFGLTHPVTVLMFVICCVLLAGIGLKRIPIELMPNYEFSEISVITRLRGGIQATEVEKNVSQPLENVLSEVNGLKEMLSASRESESVVVLKFKSGVNLDFATLDIREKIATIKHKLPREIEKPVIAKFQQFDVPFLILVLTSDDYSTEQLRQMAEEKVKERLLRVSGVANIEIGGGRERKILVDIDNSRLIAYNLPVLEVTDKIGLNNISLSVGEMNETNKNYMIRAIGDLKNMQQIRDIGVGVTPAYSAIRVKDIATVKDSYYDPTSFARINIKDVVSLYIQRESGANTIKTADAVEKEIEKLRNILPQNITLAIVKNDADYIKAAVKSLKQSLFYGAIIVSAVLFLFLRNVRTISIIALMLPVSISITVIFFYISQLSFNIMTLSGLALGLGMLGDNAIVLTENVFFYKGKEPSTRTDLLIIKACDELVMPIIASNVTTLIVFLPLVFLEPEVKRLYVPFAQAITYALISSMITTFMLVPILTLKFQKSFHRADIPGWYNYTNKKFLSLLKNSFRYRKHICWGIVAVFIVSMIILSRRDMEFIESGDALTFRIGIQFPAGMVIEKSNQIVKSIETELMTYPQVKRVSSRIEKLHTFLEVKVHSDVEKLKDSFRKKFANFSPAFIYYEESEQAGSRELFIDFYGYDYETLKQLTFASAKEIGKVPKLTDVKIRMREDAFEENILPEQSRLTLFNMSTQYFATSLHNLLRGLVATYYRSEGKEVETITRLTPQTIQLTEQLPRLQLVSLDGTIVTVNQVAEMKRVKTPQEIWRKNKKRFVGVSCMRTKMGLGRAAKNIDRVMKNIKFPKDYLYKISGDYEKAVRNQTAFAFAVFLTVVLIYLVLASLFESYLQPFIIMLAIPLGLIGISFVLFVFKKPISIGVWIGLIIFAGVAVNNAILIIDRINARRKKFRTLTRAIFYSAQEKLKEILMTSITTILGLVPLVLSRSESAAMWNTLGLTVIGGLTVSTFLVLFFIPIVYTFLDTVKSRLKIKS